MTTIKNYYSPGNLKNHVFSHTNERPYRCELCGRGFNQMSNLVVHKFKSHGQTGHVQRSPRSSPEAKATKRTKPAVKSKSAHSRKNSSAESLSLDGFTINVIFHLNSPVVKNCNLPPLLLG
jgi:Zinc finger, C2H2 type